MRFGARTLFENVSWHVTVGEKVGLVGDNGIGKTTLLKIIDAQILPEEGQVTMTPGIVTGYLPQGGIEPAGRTLREEMLEAFGEVNTLKAELEELRHEIDHSRDPDPRLLNRFADIEQQLHAYGADRVEPKIHAVLTGLGFGHDELDRPLAEFSGGWQMRAALGKLLLSSPDILQNRRPRERDAHRLPYKLLRLYPGEKETHRASACNPRATGKGAC
jgi:ATP-binding cassette subfamily F protein 3